jgi:hypothetical protein
MSRIQLLCRSLPTLATSPEPLSLETFAPFPRLPHELRIKIWKYAANISRNITVTIGRQDQTQINQPPAPPILQATKESRNEAMRYYTLCMDSAGPPPLLGRNLGGKVYPPVWINFTVDVFLYLSEEFFHNREVQTPFDFDDSVLSRIQHVEMQGYGGLDTFKEHMTTTRKILATCTLQGGFGSPDSMDESFGEGWGIL